MVALKLLPYFLFCFHRYLEAYEKIHHQGEDAAETMAAYKPSVPVGQVQGSNRITGESDGMGCIEKLQDY